MDSGGQWAGGGSSQEETPLSRAGATEAQVLVLWQLQLQRNVAAGELTPTCPPAARSQPAASLPRWWGRGRGSVVSNQVRHRPLGGCLAPLQTPPNHRSACPPQPPLS